MASPIPKEIREIAEQAARDEIFYATDDGDPIRQSGRQVGGVVAQAVWRALQDGGYVDEIPAAAAPLQAGSGDPGAAWESYLEAIDEPPFDESHHRYHTPNQPLEDCASCRYVGWVASEDAERDLFMAGWNAAKAAK